MVVRNKGRSPVIKQLPLSDIVAEELRQRIWQGDFQAGERLIEADLASEMEISRSSLREALQILENEKLVVNKSRKGTFINHFTERDIAEITEVRLCLEVPALIQAAKNLTEDDRNYLNHLLELMRQNLEKEDWYELFNIEMEFHRYLVDLCNNSRIRDIYCNLLVQIRTYFNLLKDYYSTRKETFYHEHKQLLDAIKTGDKRIVEKAVLDHIRLLT